MGAERGFSSMMWWLAGAWYASLSVIAAGMYVLDKHRAKVGGRRVPEARLHLVALLGGWPGAAIARQGLRHKTRKRAFGAVLAVAAAMHLATWALVLLR